MSKVFPSLSPLNSPTCHKGFLSANLTEPEIKTECNRYDTLLAKGATASMLVLHLVGNPIAKVLVSYIPENGKSLTFNTLTDITNTNLVKKKDYTKYTKNKSIDTRHHINHFQININEIKDEDLLNYIKKVTAQQQNKDISMSANFSEPEYPMMGGRRQTLTKHHRHRKSKTMKKKPSRK